MRWRQAGDETRAWGWRGGLNVGVAPGIDSPDAHIHSHTHTYTDRHSLMALASLKANYFFFLSLFIRFAQKNKK